MCYAQVLQLQGRLGDVHVQLTSLQAELAARAEQSRSREEQLRASLLESERTAQALAAELASSREDVERNAREHQQKVSVARRLVHDSCRNLPLNSVNTQDDHLVSLETTARAVGGLQQEVSLSCRLGRKIAGPGGSEPSAPMCDPSTAQQLKSQSSSQIWSSLRCVASSRSLRRIGRLLLPARAGQFTTDITRACGPLSASPRIDVVGPQCCRCARRTSLPRPASSGVARTEGLMPYSGETQLPAAGSCSIAHVSTVARFRRLRAIPRPDFLLVDASQLACRRIVRS